MGASVFMTTEFGKTADAAFEKAVENAEYHHGKAGYTGTIAEKNSYTKIPADEYEDGNEREYARKLIDEQDERVRSKRGPAGAIRLKEAEEVESEGDQGALWLFFGWAST